MMRARRSKARSVTFCRYVGFAGPRYRSSADIQDRDGGIAACTLFGMYPFLKKLFADGGYQGRN